MIEVVPLDEYTYQRLREKIAPQMEIHKSIDALTGFTFKKFLWNNDLSTQLDIEDDSEFDCHDDMKARKEKVL